MRLLRVYEIIVVGLVFCEVLRVLNSYLELMIDFMLVNSRLIRFMFCCSFCCLFVF